MELTKLTITPQKWQETRLVPDLTRQIKVLFNPNSYSITKTVSWETASPFGAKQDSNQRQLNAPVLSFGGGGSRELTLQLFFDTTEASGTIGEAVGIAGEMTDVRKVTDQLVALTRIVQDQRQHWQPPVCEVAWGKPSKDFPFVGVIKSLTQQFTLFRSDGTPVRANLTVVLKEFRDPQADQRETDPELTTRLVKRGDTLSGLAGEVYQDSRLWRIIAEANQIDDPRRLEPGQALKIPKLS